MEEKKTHHLRETNIAYKQKKYDYELSQTSGSGFDILGHQISEDMFIHALKNPGSLLHAWPGVIFTRASLRISRKSSKHSLAFALSMREAEMRYS